MTDRIRVQNLAEEFLDEASLRQAALAVLSQDGVDKRACLTIVVTDGDTLRKLNRTYRQVDSATDVLSFAAPELPDEIKENDGYLGDVFLAYDYIARQAGKRGTELADTLSLLVVHGALHLLGFEHDTQAACERMWLAQAQALDELGIDSKVVQAYEMVKHV